MKLYQWSFLIYIFLKPYYVFESGAMQLGDLFLLISVVLYMYYKNKNGLKEITINSIDRLLVYFTISVILINGFYAVYHQRIDFVVSTLHYIFNFILIIFFRSYSKSPLFLDNLFKVCKLNLWIQLIIYLIGLGEYFWDIRYMGTFNDPNQMAFFIYSSFLLIYLLSKIIDKQISIFYYLICLFLIFQTASTGILLAIFSFVFLLLVLNFNSVFNTKIKVKAKTIIVVNFVLMSSIFVISINPTILNSISDSFIIERVEEKISKIGSTDNISSNSYGDLSLIEERGIDKLILYPERLLFGSGQGYYARFDEAAHNNEIHSTLPSILFYYGTIPTIILLIWFNKNVRKLSYVTILVFIPLILESFTLLNQRQPFFWMIFVLSYIYIEKINKRQML